MTLHALLTRLFKKPEEINGNGRCSTYLYRWVVWRGKSFKVYLHHFVGDDWSLDLHDHPKRFISIGLWGWYEEEIPCPSETPGAPESFAHTHRTIYRAPWYRSFPAEHIHRLRVPDKNTWTLVIVGRGSREWGFWHGGRFLHWRAYVYGEHAHIADEMKDCG